MPNNANSEISTSEVNSQVLISFVVPYHNEPQSMLTHCIDSIHHSCTAVSYEIIVVDDGSDVSLAPFFMSHPHLSYVRHTSARGLSAARNTGIEAARGKYIQFVDSDDYLIPLSYAKIAWMAHDMDADLVLFGEKRKGVALCSGTDHMLHHNLRAAAWSYVFKRDILQGLRFTEGILHEDEEFTPLLMLRAKQTVLTPIDAYHYTQRQGSITSTDDAAWSARRLDDLEGVITRLSTIAKTLDGDAKAALSRRVNQLCMDYIYQSMRLTHSIHETRKRAESLRLKRLYPLPIHTYTWKYWLFSIFTQI